MIRFIIKVLLTSVLIVTISEVGKRNSIMAAVYASLPLTTLLAMVWLYLDTYDTQKVSSLSWNVLIAVIPSHVFLIAFPLLVKYGFNFWISLFISMVLTAIAYWAYAVVLKHYGIHL
jgi:putative Ca2+/H+ antiporter (TMEM165/GDT1 family)